MQFLLLMLEMLHQIRPTTYTCFEETVSILCGAVCQSMVDRIRNWSDGVFIDPIKGRELIGTEGRLPITKGGILDQPA